MSSTPANAEAWQQHPQAWPATWTLALGFFMIMIDSMIVSVATPAIMSWFKTDVTSVMWVSSAYLLAYAIPLLISGRLGDRYGPRLLYLIGLSIFTTSSLWCGLAPTIQILIIARGLQGFGAALMSPQTMAILTRIFPPRRRGAAMGIWGATAGLAGIVGPILGGTLVDGLDWRWIFFINVPIGCIAFVLVWCFVPSLDKHPHRWDWLGVILNAVAVSLLVVGLQEGQAQRWPAWIFGMLLAGLIMLGVFVWSQTRRSTEPLMPLQLFADRNFTAANLGIAVMGFVIVSMSFPLMLYLQNARGMSPTQAALMSLPQALLSMVLSPIAGKMINNRPTKPFVVTGFVILTSCLVAVALLLRPDVAVWWLLIPLTIMAISSAAIWGPLSVSATRNLPNKWAGAGSGVYNSTRQLGSVLGSAAIATMIAWQFSIQLPHGSARSTTHHTTLPPALLEPFSQAMRNAELLPAAVAALGIVAGLLLRRPVFSGETQEDADAIVSD